MPSNGILGTAESSSPAGHGTAMLSLIAGYELGVAKRVTPILARVPRRNPNGLGATPEDWLAAIAAVSDDLDQYQAGRSGNTATAIVLLAIYYPRTLFIKGDTDYSLYIANKWAGVLNSMVAKGAVLVTGSGNANEDSGGTTVDGFPGGFGSNPPINNWPYIPELLVAGPLIPSTGAVSAQTKMGNAVPNIWAPGDSIYAANGNKAGWPAGEIAPGSKGTSDGTWPRLTNYFFPLTS